MRTEIYLPWSGSCHIGRLYLISFNPMVVVWRKEQAHIEDRGKHATATLSIVVAIIALREDSMYKPELLKRTTARNSATAAGGLTMRIALTPSIR